MLARFIGLLLTILIIAALAVVLDAQQSKTIDIDLTPKKSDLRLGNEYLELRQRIEALEKQVAALQTIPQRPIKFFRVDSVAGIVECSSCAYAER